MKQFIPLLLLLSVSMVSFSQNKEDSIPKNLIEAVAQLQNIHSDSTKQQIMKMTEREFLGDAHFGLGMRMRNNWGLWKGSKLKLYFNSIGIFHPDDMSGIILCKNLVFILQNFAIKSSLT